MKRGLKNILIIILILILTIGTFNCAKKIMIRNIFDEMYFGTKDVWGGHLTSTSWNNMSGLAKMNDSSKYEIPNIIRIYFSKLYLTENENFSVLWRMDIKQLQFIYAVYFQKSEEINEIILDIYYSPCQKRLEVHPLRVASNNNIYGDTSREAVDGFFEKYGISEAAFYARVTEVFKMALIENWRTGNPTTLFQDTLGEFETVYKEVEN